MVCLNCREDLPKEMFEWAVYKNAVIGGYFPSCLECLILPKSERMTKRLEAIARFKGEAILLKKHKAKNNKKKKAKKSAADKAWARLDAKGKRQKCVEGRTPFELSLDAALRNAGVEFDFQVHTGCYFLDFQIAPLKLAVEVDGGYHFTEEQKKKDAKRTAFLRRANWTILRFTNAEVAKDVDGVVTEIVAKRNSLMAGKVVKLKKPSKGIYDSVVVVAPGKPWGGVFDAH